MPPKPKEILLANPDRKLFVVLSCFRGVRLSQVAVLELCHKGQMLTEELHLQHMPLLPVSWVSCFGHGQGATSQRKKMAPLSRLSFSQ